MKLLQVVLLLIPLLCRASIVSFLQLTDIHYDPNYNGFESPSTNCNGNLNSGTEYPYGQYGCDSPALLLQSMIESIQQLPVVPKWIVNTGDNVGHSVTDESAALDTFRYVVQNITSTFPGVPMYQVIGNNDLYPKNSMEDNNSAYLQRLQSALQPAVSYPSSVWTTFSQGGYYSQSPIPGIRVIVLNTIFYFTDVTPKPSNDTDPAGQFAWLAQEMNSASTNEEKVIITCHMGVGGSRQSNIIWKDKYVKSFVNLIQPYSSIIIAVLEGHTHRDLFNLIYPIGHSSSVIHQAPSNAPFAVSLNSGSMVTSSANNPSYRVYYMNLESMQLVDYVQMVFDFTTNEWQSYYRFSDLTGEQPTPQGLMSLYERIQAGTWPPGQSTKSMCNYISTIWATNSTQIWSNSQYVSDCWTLYCSITQLTKNDLNACVQNPPVNLNVCYNNEPCTNA